eukprot:scaffold41846_cov57-Phaeocystis_antarctica.AAC.2
MHAALSKERQRGSFLRTRLLFTNLPARLAPYELTHVRASPVDCVRLAGRKRHARLESSEALAEKPAVARALPWSCTTAALRYRVSLAEALLRQLIDGVARASIAQAPRAGRAGAPWSRSPCWRPSRVRCARLEGPARARRRIEFDIVGAYATLFDTDFVFANRTRKLPMEV